MRGKTRCGLELGVGGLPPERCVDRGRVCERNCVNGILGGGPRGGGGGMSDSVSRT